MGIRTYSIANKVSSLGSLGELLAIDPKVLLVEVAAANGEKLVLYKDNEKMTNWRVLNKSFDTLVARMEQL